MASSGILNEYNDKTKKVIHLMVTSLCDRNCPHCCNKQYDLNDIPYVTDEELKQCEILCITGGEPFAYSRPAEIARRYKYYYPNIKKVYVYTNAIELYVHCLTIPHSSLEGIDGLNVSIKNAMDKAVFDGIVRDDKVLSMDSNRLYIFDDKLMPNHTDGFKVIKREWQEDFKPADDSIFRKI